VGTAISRYLRNRASRLTWMDDMRVLKTIRLRLRSLFRSRHVEQELDAELRGHLEWQIEFHRAAGLSPADARDAALREFGNVPLIQEQCRDTRRVNWIEDLIRDAGYALRSMRRAPGFTAVALFSLAVAIGANTAIFSLLDAVLLRPLPVAAPEQLVLIDGSYDADWSLISYPMYRDLAERQQVFSGVLASTDFLATPLRVRTRASNAARAVRGGAVSGNYFSTLGLVPAHGRLLVPADDTPGNAASVAVVSYDFWRRELGGTSSVVGQTVVINEEPVTVIGVAPAGFRGLSIDSSLDMWVPLTKFRPARDLRNRRGTFFRLVGRLKPGVTIAHAQTAMTLLFQQLRAEELQTTGASGSGARVESYRIALGPGDKGYAFFRERVGRTLTILMAMAGLLVAIVCMNLTTLLSARATARQRELAVRQALGASRRRLLQQSLTENLLLAILGGTLGLVFAVWASRILLNLVSTDIALHSGFNQYVPDGLRFQFNWRILAFTEGIALLVGLFLALAPAPFLNRPDVITLLKQRTMQSQGSIRHFGIPFRKILVVSQVAFSVVLLVGAGLMVRTVINLRGLDLGFDPANVLLVDFDVTGTGRTASQLTAFEQRLHERLNTLPGVRSASLSWIPLFSGTDWRMRVAVGGDALLSATEPVAARRDVVSAGYFETVGLTLVAGRTFTSRDNESAPPVAVVNEAFVRRLFGRDNPIGKRFAVGGPALVKEIVGVVKDAKYNDLREGAREMFYVPRLQTPASAARSIQVRTVVAPQMVVQQIREVVREADPNIVITETKTLADQVDRTLVRERLLADLSGFFGGAALLLACIGLYSVLAYHVIQRTQEIGVRIALGSPRGSVMWLVVRDALLLVGLGVVFGVAAALALSHSIASQLFGVSPTDPATITAIVMILLGVAGVSCYLPARRAAGVDPIVALGAE
jgi:predicted permease